MEILEQQHITGLIFYVDLALVKYPEGEYRVLSNYVPTGMGHRSAGYLSTQGFRPNQHKAALLQYLRVAGEYLALRDEELQK